MILQNLFLVKNKGVKTGCARKGGRGKHNSIFSCGAFRKAKYEIWRRRKEIGIGKRGRAKIPSPQPPARLATRSVAGRPSFSPARAFSFCRAKRGNQSGFCSKKVRAAFSNCDQFRHFENSEAFCCSQKALPSCAFSATAGKYFRIKSKGRTNSNSVFRESKRRFGIAKQFIPQMRDIQFFPFRLRRNTKQVFNPALLRQRRNAQRRQLLT